MRLDSEKMRTSRDGVIECRCDIVLIRKASGAQDVGAGAGARIIITAMVSIHCPDHFIVVIQIRGVGLGQGERHLDQLSERAECIRVKEQFNI